MGSFFGIPSRSKHQSDDEFVGYIRSSIKKRKYFRIFWAIIAISSLILLYLYFMFFFDNKIEYFEMRNFQWIGFISGFIFNGISFSVITNSASAIANWFEGFPSHRAEDLLIKYHDELKKKLPNHGSRNFKDSFLGIPLRSKHQSDDEFVVSVRNYVKKRKHIRPVWAIIPISSGLILILCFMRLLNPESEYVPEIWISQWRGFVYGFTYGGICFMSVFYFVFAILWCSDGLRIHRIEELIIKYYDELKKNIAEPDSDTIRQSHDIHA